MFGFRTFGFQTVGTKKPEPHVRISVIWAFGPNCLKSERSDFSHSGFWSQQSEIGTFLIGFQTAWVLLKCLKSEQICSVFGVDWNPNVRISDDDCISHLFVSYWVSEINTVNVWNLNVFRFGTVQFCLVVNCFEQTKTSEIRTFDK